MLMAYKSLGEIHKIKNWQKAKKKKFHLESPMQVQRATEAHFQALSKFTERIAEVLE
jgi:hypothetical protein